jgi:DNA-binding transcriptional ArsR family regulator
MPSVIAAQTAGHSDVPDPGELTGLLTVLTALADPVRLAVVRALGRIGEANCTQLRLASGVTCGKSTLSHHMRVLREAGVINTRAVGTQQRASLRTAEMEAAYPGLLPLVAEIHLP